MVKHSSACRCIQQGYNWIFLTYTGNYLREEQFGHGNYSDYVFQVMEPSVTEPIYILWSFSVILSIFLVIENL